MLDETRKFARLIVEEFFIKLACSPRAANKFRGLYAARRIVLRAVDFRRHKYGTRITCTVYLNRMYVSRYCTF